MMCDGETRQRLTWNGSRGLEGISWGSREQSASSIGSRVVNLKRTWKASVSAGVIMRGGHCLKVWTKKQQVVSLSTAESELHAAVKTASEG